MSPTDIHVTPTDDRLRTPRISPSTEIWIVFCWRGLPPGSTLRLNSPKLTMQGYKSHSDVEPMRSMSHEECPRRPGQGRSGRGLCSPLWDIRSFGGSASQRRAVLAAQPSPSHLKTSTDASGASVRRIPSIRSSLSGCSQIRAKPVTSSWQGIGDCHTDLPLPPSSSTLACHSPLSASSAPRPDKLPIPLRNRHGEALVESPLASATCQRRLQPGSSSPPSVNTNRLGRKPTTP